MSQPLPSTRFPSGDAEVADFARALDLPGIIDIHVHLLPDRLQKAVWAFFDRLEDPPWPITYRQDEDRRLETLRELGVIAHTALAYPHKPGVARWCNEHTLAAAERHPQVLPTFTFFPEPDVDAYVDEALSRGGRVAKVHLQVGKFDAVDPRLRQVWRRLEDEAIPIVIHAGAVYGVPGGQEYCGADVLRGLLDQHPDLRLVVAHLGMPDIGDFVALAEETPGLRMDTSMALADPAYGDEVPAPMLPRLHAMADRLLFGSDFPAIPHAFAAGVRGLATLELDADQLRDVLHDNAARMLGLPTSAASTPRAEA